MQETLTGRLIGTRGNKLLATRRGNVIVAAVAAILAAILLLAYLSSYRTSLRTAAQPTPVLVANRLITKNTPADVLGAQAAFELTTLPREHTKTGAVSDPDLIAGRVAIRDILPGQQLTVADFSADKTNALATKLTGSERALAVPVDPQHGLIGHISVGEKVDVYVSITPPNGLEVVSLVRANVQVISTPAATAGLGSGAISNYLLKVPSDDVGRFALASERGKIWIVARPAANFVPTKKAIVTIQQILTGQRGG